MLLPAIIGMAAFSTLFVYLGLEVWKFEYSSTIAVHSILGFVISMLLVFRTNTAYDRWWEGRKLWGGFVNGSRSFSMKLAAFAPHSETRIIQALLTNYFIACKDHLRREMSTKQWIEIPERSVDQYTNASHIPNALLADLIAELVALQKRGVITEMQLLMLDNELRAFADNLGACERIRATPIPYSYSMFIKKIIFFYTITIPFGLLTDYGYWTVLVTSFVFYAFASLELLAEEIEDPFGREPNDLPTDEIAEGIRKQVKGIFGNG